MFVPVVCASLFNSFANIIRPDAAIIWQVSIVGGCMHHAPLLTPLLCTLYFIAQLDLLMLSHNMHSLLLRQARIPRALWEICIAFVAKSANEENTSACLLLCLMLLPTALVDIFVWAPSFAWFARFESCQGGGILSRQPRVCTADYAKGIGRLFVTAQSLATGVLYLFAAVVSWTVWAETRDSSIAKKNARAIADALPNNGREMMRH